MKEEIQKTLEVLKNSGTILYPTDTIWGIGCDATNGDAVAKVYKMKNQGVYLLQSTQVQGILNLTT